MRCEIILVINKKHSPISKLVDSMFMLMNSCDSMFELKTAGEHTGLKKQTRTHVMFIYKFSTIHSHPQVCNYLENINYLIIDDKYYNYNVF